MADMCLSLQRRGELGGRREEWRGGGGRGGGGIVSPLVDLSLSIEVEPSCQDSFWMLIGYGLIVISLQALAARELSTPPPSSTDFRKGLNTDESPFVIHKGLQFSYGITVRDKYRPAYDQPIRIRI
jgi:hypothetical protein